MVGLDNQDEIIENEKRISDFMKVENVFPYIDRDGFFGMYIAEDNEGSIDYTHSGINWLNYKSWKNIMPVVENIESIFETEKIKESVDITSHHVRYSHYNEHYECEFRIIVGCFLDSPEKIKAESKLEAVYMVVTEFIKWYSKAYDTIDFNN